MVCSSRGEVLVVDESGMVYLTPEMEQRIQFSGDVERVIVDVNLQLNSDDIQLPRQHQ